MRNFSRGWRVTHMPPPGGVSRWRWLLGNYYRKLLWLLGLHWKQRKVTLTWERFQRLVRTRMIEDHVRWNHIVRRDPCSYCGRVLSFETMTVEHVVPKSHKGVDLSRNKVGACGSCNRRRGSRTLLSFLLAEHTGKRHQFWVVTNQQKHDRYWQVAHQRQREAEKKRAAKQVAETRRQDRKTMAPVLSASMAELMVNRIAGHDARLRQPDDVDLRRRKPR